MIRTLVALGVLAAPVLLVGCGKEPACEAHVRIEAASDAAVLLEACADVARSEADRIKGLSGRDSLPEDEALILEAPVEDTFCITNEPVVFPIDAVYASEAGDVVAVEHAIPAGESGFRCHDNVRRVIELASGVAESVTTGDLVTIR